MAITAAQALFLRKADVPLSKTSTETHKHTIAHQTSTPVSLATLTNLPEVTASDRRKLRREESCLHFSIVSLLHQQQTKPTEIKATGEWKLEYKCLPASLTRKGEKPWFTVLRFNNQLGIINL